MRQLNQRTAHVIDEINRSKEPAAITKHGRFVAVILPLEGAEVESLVLRQGPIADEIERRSTNPGSETFSTEQMLDAVGQDDAVDDEADEDTGDDVEQDDGYTP